MGGYCGAELPTLLYYGGDSVKDSVITLKRTGGGKLASVADFLSD